MILTLFLRIEQIDLDERMASGRLLSLPKIESLVRYCRIRMDDVLEHEPKPQTARASKVTSLERAWQTSMPPCRRAHDESHALAAR